jgi:hypothetical protein
VVVDLAVERDPDSAVLVAHRLLAAGDVDNRQPPVRKARATVDDQALAVGSAMRDHIAHPHEPIFLGPLGGIEFQNSGNATHG